MELVRFINFSDDKTDQIVSFALAYDEMEIRSLTLIRTPKFEAMLNESERGVSVSLEGETSSEGNSLMAIIIGANSVMIETHTSKYDLDISRVDSMEVSAMKALFERMNFDDSFRIVGV